VQVEARRVEVRKEVALVAELRKVGLEAVSTADKDTLCAIAVHAAAQEGVDMNTRAEAAAGEEPKESWLSVAAEEGLGETVRAMLAAGAEVDHASNQGWTALRAAAYCGQVDAIRALLLAGADINHASNDG
jgi:ankyrin repeat protein